MSTLDTTRLRALLEALVADLSTQDNAATADPYYTVQQQVRDWGIEDGFEDGFAWCDENGDEADGELAAALTAHCHEVFDTEIEWDEVMWTKRNYRERWEHVQAFLTQGAALAFMEREKHNRGPMRTWVESACRNPQMRQLRDLPAQALALLDEVEQLRARLVRQMKCPGCDGEMPIPRDAEDGSEHTCVCGKTLFLHEDDASELRFLCDYCEGDPFDECDFCGRVAGESEEGGTHG